MHIVDYHNSKPSYRRNEQFRIIKKLEKIEVPIIEIDDPEIDASCNECGSDDVYVKFRGHNKVIDPKFVDDIRDQAWHILADITD